MSISNGSIPIGATYAPSGGSATSLVSLGGSLGEQKVFIDDSSDLALRKTAVVTSKPPTPLASAPNGYTQQRSAIVFHIPLLLDNGNYTINKVSIEMSFDIETDASEMTLLREFIAHVGVDTDFDDLFEQGSTA
jgi:hypothetical protein